LIGLILIGCGNSDLTNDIHGIWVGDYKMTLYFDPDENRLSSLPMLIDLVDSNNATIKYFYGKEVRTNWEINDSILTLDSINYRIISITNDSIVYSPYLKENDKPPDESINDDYPKAVPIRDEYFVFKRIKDKKLKYSEKEMNGILNNKLWHKTHIDPATPKFGNWLEFLDNGVAVFKMTDDSTKETSLLDECWRIENYNGYSFLFFYINWYQNNGYGALNDGYQLLEITENEFILDRFSGKQSAKYQLVKTNPDQAITSNLIGKWISDNDTTAYYSSNGRIINDRYIKQGKYKLYDDTLVYQFHMDSLIITGKGILPRKCKWRLNSDNTILIYEYLLDREDFIGYHVEYSNIELVSNDSLKIKLCYLYLPTGCEKPQMIIVNRNQEFKRVE